MGILGACAAALLAGVGGVKKMISHNSSSPNKAIYYITETSGPTSYDPLDGDKTNNLSVQRMIYLTPLEVSQDDKLVSQILSDFNYNNVNHEITLRVGTDKKFSDGTDIEPMDVVLAITRMLHKRPNFPVIRSILGKEEWLKQSEPLKTLPSGISLQDNEIKIQLQNKEYAPLYRFCLELFSIIPRRCIDLATGNIQCEDIPTSGPYTIQSITENEIKFQRSSQQTIYGLHLPQEIQFIYKPIDEILNKRQLSGNEVVATNEARLTKEQMQQLVDRFKVNKKPSSRFSILLINKKSQLFANNNLRAWFAQQFRQAYKDVNHLDSMESSIFTKILPGYMTHEELSSQLAGLTAPSTEEIKLLENLQWIDSVSSYPHLLREPLQKVFTDLGLTLPEPLNFENAKQFEQAFSMGQIDFMYATTGFWPLDPVGDIQMLFTPHLHEALEGVWSDANLQNLLSSLNDSQNDFEMFKDVNKYLFKEAYFNVFGYHARFFILSENQIDRILPMGITTPPPWMLFASDDN